MKVNAIYKGFTIRTDQPKYAGGDGSGPEPFDLFFASIGTCAGIYVVDFCLQRNIPTDDMKIIIKIERDEEKGMITRLPIEILLPKQFPKKYLKAVVRAVDLCAVKKHIMNPPEFSIDAKIVE